MNRDRQMVKSIQNKLAQAREEYAKNKSLLGEYKVKERTTDFVHPADIDQPDIQQNKDIDKDK